MTCPKCHGEKHRAIPMPYPIRGYTLRRCIRCNGTGEIKEPTPRTDGAEQAKVI